MAICITNYKLVITFADKTQKIVSVQASHLLKLPTDAQLTVIETATRKSPTKLLSKRQGNALVIEIEGEGELTKVVDFYDSLAQFTPQMALTSDIESALMTEMSAADAAVCLPPSLAAADKPALSPLMNSLALGGVVATMGVLSLGGDSAPMVNAQGLSGNTTPPTSTTFTTVSAIDINADTGTSATDFVTKTASQTITATLSASLATGEALFGSVDGGSTWTNITNFVSGTAVSWAGATLAGISSIQLQIRDAAGNTLTTATQAYTLDTTAPTTIINVNSIDISADTGSPTDFVTQTTAQTITATLSAALAVGEALYGSVNGGTTWVNITDKVAGTAVSWDGANLSGTSIKLQVRDAAGNNGATATQAYTLEANSFMLADIVSVSNQTNGLLIVGAINDQLSSNDISNLGDVNGDGLDDVLVGVDGSGVSRTYVVFGTTQTTPIMLSTVGSGTGGFVITDNTSIHDNVLIRNNTYNNDRALSGSVVAGLGDINGDGLGDFSMSAKGADPSGRSNAGKVYVIYGKATNSAIDISSIESGSASGFLISGGAANNSIGYSASGVGDFNGDGFNDLLIASNNTQSYLVFGKSTASNIDLASYSASDAILLDNGANTTGLSLSGAGDVNGDGLADLLIGAPYATQGLFQNGVSYVVFGRSGTATIDLASVATGAGGGFAIVGASANERAGHGVTNAGDFNGDGLGDLLVSTNSGVPGAISKTYIVYGKTDIAAFNLADLEDGSRPGLVLTSEVTSNYSGYQSSYAGDINGDGLADVLISAYKQANGSLVAAGASYVVFGTTHTGAVNLADVAAGIGGFAIRGAAQADNTSSRISAGGDFNGDGLADLLINQANNNPVGYSGTRVGYSYIVLGSTTGAFRETSVDWLGTVSDDTNSDGGIVKTLVAGAGNDALTATAASVLYGGAGNDTFVIDAAMVTALASPMGSGGNVNQLARIDGGSGTDIISLAGSGLTFDLTQVANQNASHVDGSSRINGVEVIDITGIGNNTVKLNLFDVLDMGSANTFDITGRQQLMVKGNSGDKVDLADGASTAGWTQVAAVSLNSVTYDVWNHNSSAAALYVSQALQVI